MPAKIQPSESTRGNGRHHRRREITGILLLAGGLFAGLSLMSRHAGDDPHDGHRRRGDRLRALRARGSRGRTSSSPECWSRRCAASARGAWSRARARRAARCCCSARSRCCFTCRSRTAASRRTVRAASWASGWAACPPPSSATWAPRWRRPRRLIVSMLMITDVSTREVAVVLGVGGPPRRARRSSSARARPGAWRARRSPRRTTATIGATAASPKRKRRRRRRARVRVDSEIHAGAQRGRVRRRPRPTRPPRGQRGRGVRRDPRADGRRRRAKASASARRAASPRRSSIRSAPRWRRSSPRSPLSSASRPQSRRPRRRRPR